MARTSMPAQRRQTLHRDALAAEWEIELSEAERAVRNLLKRVHETRREDVWREHSIWRIHRERLLDLRRMIHAVTL